MANRGLLQAAGSWSWETCCAGNNKCLCAGNVCYCDDYTSSSDWLFGLWPGPPQRFEPTGTDTAYQYIQANWWPNWGSGVDLSIGESSGARPPMLSQPSSEVRVVLGCLGTELEQLEGAVERTRLQGAIEREELAVRCDELGRALEQRVLLAERMQHEAVATDADADDAMAVAPHAEQAHV